MIRTDEIRIIPQFSGQTTGVTESDLSFRSGYWVYTSSFGGNLVDEFTVRDFLDNPNNEEIATKFFNFLQENFLKPEFNELYYNNLKLANSFNDYYDKTVRANIAPTKTVAQLQLTATTAVTYTNTNFIDYRNRSNKKITAVIGYNTGDSYYLSVPISSSFNILDNQNYDKYRKNSLGETQSYVEAELFKYVIRQGQEISTPDINVVKQNSFDNYIAKSPLPTNPPLLRIQFKNNKYIIPTTNQSSTIPFEIVFDKPSPFQGQSFQLVLGADLVGFIDPTWVSFEENQPRHNKFFTIMSGQTSIIANIYLNKFNLSVLQDPKMKIEIKLWTVGDPTNLYYTVSNESFFIQTQKPVNSLSPNNLSYDYVKEGVKLRPQVLLQSFVDLNFNDSESEFYRNKNFLQIPTVIP